MEACQPWELGNRKSSRSLTLQVVLGGKGLTLRLPPVALLLVVVLGFASYEVANSRALSLQQRQAEKVAKLEHRNEMLERSLSEKEKEREQMVALADSRSEELWSELHSRDRELQRLWRIVGAKPTSVNRKGQNRRHALVASRSGKIGKASLDVKVQYHHLLNEFQETGKELESLTTAAKAYRQAKVEEYRRKLASVTPSIWPCDGEMTSGFGPRVHPVYGIGRLHAGCDFTTPHGTNIRATAAGTVVHSDWLGGYGKTIEIDHGRGLKTLYAHCSELKVKKGDKVQKGQLIGQVGTTGLSSGPHCHYEVHKNKKPIDPTPYLVQKDAPRPVAKL